MSVKFCGARRAGKIDRRHDGVKKGKFIVTLGLACLLLLSAAAGCSKNSGTDPAGEEEQKEETDAGNGPREGVYAE